MVGAWRIALVVALSAGCVSSEPPAVAIDLAPTPAQAPPASVQGSVAPESTEPVAALPSAEESCEAPAEPSSKTGAGAPAITPLGADRYAVSGAWIQATIDNPEGLMSEARFLPTTSQGAVDGLLIRSPRQGSAVAQLGLRDGDIVRAVGGAPISDLGALMQLGSSAQLTSPLVVQVERGGQRLSLTYELR